MARFVALLRGINVGGNKMVPMARLKALLERLGYTDVVTLLQSGNVVFGSRVRRTAQLEQSLEAAIEEEFGFQVSVLVRTHAELAAVVAANPLPGAEKTPSQFLVTFLSGVPEPARLAELDAEAYRPDEFRAVGREIYARFPQGIGRSKLAVALGKARLGVTSTARNWSTVTKLVALSAE